jgi:hypothetical protein
MHTVIRYTVIVYTVSRYAVQTVMQYIAMRYTIIWCTVYDIYHRKHEYFHHLIIAYQGCSPHNIPYHPFSLSHYLSPSYTMQVYSSVSRAAKKLAVYLPFTAATIAYIISAALTDNTSFLGYLWR